MAKWSDREIALGLARTEHQEQTDLVARAALPENLEAYPELALLYAIPNGGKRSRWQGALLKAEGVKPGVPDLCLPVGRWGFLGLYIEMKRKKGGKEKEAQQVAWQQRLKEQGYMVRVCRGADEAWRLVQNYLAGFPTLKTVPID